MSDRRDVLVVGGGVAGLVAARALARNGRAVTLLEADHRLGGCVTPVTVAGLTLDGGAESFATRTSAVPDLLEELGLAGDIVAPRHSAWVQLPDRAAPLPRAGALGIPSEILSAEVRRAIGTWGAVRAGLDQISPLWWGRSPGTSLADVVGRRMGRRVLDRLVAPVVTGVYSTRPEDLPLDAMPGLAAELRRRGSLAKASRALRAASPSGAAVGGLAGGMHRMVTALAADLALLGVEVRLSSRVDALERDRAGWRATMGTVVLGSRQVVLAVPGPVAARLLGALDIVTPATARSDVVLVTLVVEDQTLDDAPRGSGVLVAEGTRVHAKALTHATAKWAWLAEVAGQGRHVLRLSYGGGTRDAPPQDRADLLRRAVQDAGQLLERPLDAVVGFGRTSWPGLPTPLADRPEVRDRLGGGIALTGSWVSGPGLASVVADAQSITDRLDPDP